MGLGVKLVAFPFPRLYITVSLGLFVVTCSNAITLAFSFSFAVLFIYVPTATPQDTTNVIHSMPNATKSIGLGAGLSAKAAAPAISVPVFSISNTCE